MDGLPLFIRSDIGCEIYGKVADVAAYSRNGLVILVGLVVPVIHLPEMPPLLRAAGVAVASERCTSRSEH